MSGVTLEDAIEMVATLKAQQNADTEVIKCLIVSSMTDMPLPEAWKHQVPLSVVEEQLFAQSSELAKKTLDAFNERVAMWNGIIRSIGSE
jgi:hypothetical protein